MKYILSSSQHICLAFFFVLKTWQIFFFILAFMVLWCYTIRGWLLWHIFLKKLTTKKVLIFRFIQAFTILNAGITAHKAYNLLVMFMSFRQRHWRSYLLLQRRSYQTEPGSKCCKSRKKSEADFRWFAGKTHWLFPDEKH